MAVKLFTLFVCAAACLIVSSASAIFGQRNFLASGMQPEVVAKTLGMVQNEWKAQAAIAAECDTTSKLPGSPIVNCRDAHNSFDKSCSTIVGAIVQGSGGDKAVTNEYMGDVCSQRAMSGWHQLHCQGLALAVVNSMSVDKYQNRMGFNSARLCSSVWSKLLGERAEEVAKDKVAHEAADKKAAEEEKLEIEAQKKEADRKKAVDAERKKQEAATKAATKAAEAKAKVAEAAVKAAEKKAEAEALAVASKQKMKEAVAAEKKAQADVKVTAAQKPVEAAAKPKAAVVAAQAVVPKPAATQPKKVIATPAASKPVSEKVSKKEVPLVASATAPKAVTEKTSNLLASAAVAAPAPAAAGGPAAAAGPAPVENLNDKMPLKAAEQGFTGKKVKHEDGKTSAADWQNEYSTK